MMRTAMTEGARLFNAGEYWEAHEAWEIPWNAARAVGDAVEANYIQALILFAAAIHKRRHYDNANGGARNYAKALKRLEIVPHDYGERDNIDLERLQQLVLEALEDEGLQPQLETHA
jgi:uncharacterized protein